MPAFEISVPFTPGRMDASQEQTDVDSLPSARATDRPHSANYLLRQAVHATRRGVLVDRAQFADADRSGDDRAPGRDAGC